MTTRADLTPKEIDELRGSLARKLAGGAAIPTLPEVAMEILRLVGDKNAGLRDFSDVIKTDQALTGKLLKLSNSAYFAQSKPVTDLNRALVLLGIERLKAIALGFRLADTIGCTEDRAKRLWNVALFRAWFSLRLAEEVEATKAGEAFISGLLLDVGEWFMPQLASDAYELVGPGTNPPARRYRLELEHLPFTHTDVADAIGRVWKLPEVLRTPIVEHHNAAATVKEGGDLLRAIAHFAGQLSLDPNNIDELSKGQARVGERLLDIPVERVLELVSMAREDYDGTASMFSKVLTDELSSESLERQAREALVDVASEMIEDELERTGADASGIRVTVGPLTYAIQPTEHASAVQVLISDSSGTQLMTEQVDPSAFTPAQLRTKLLADRATDQEFASLFDSIQRIAA